MLELGVALLMTAVAPLSASVLPVATAGLAKRQRRAQSITIFTAPPPASDVRRLDLLRLTAPAAARNRDPAAFAADADREEDGQYRIATLVADDREARYSGRRARKSAMAAGLSLRMTNADGVLASEIGVAGSVGKALSRMALEAVTPN